MPAVPQQQQHKATTAAATNTQQARQAAVSPDGEHPGNAASATGGAAIFLEPPAVNDLWPFLKDKGGWTYHDGVYKCDGAVAARGGNGDGVLKFMLQNGIPHIDQYSMTERDMIERAVRSFHVPRNLLKTALTKTTTNNGGAGSSSSLSVSIPNDDDVWPILQKMGAKELSDGSFRFPNRKQTLTFPNLDQVRAYMREEGIFTRAAGCSDGEKLRVLIWAATSPQPLKTFAAAAAAANNNRTTPNKSKTSPTTPNAAAAAADKTPETPKETPNNNNNTETPNNNNNNNNNKTPETPATAATSTATNHGGGGDDEEGMSEYDEASDDEDIDQILKSERELGARNGRISELKGQVSAEKLKLKRTKAEMLAALDERLKEASAKIDRLETNKKRCLSKLSTLSRVNCQDGLLLPAVEQQEGQQEGQEEESGNNGEN